MKNILTITQLNNQIKSLLESHYQNLWVKGEVSRVTYHSSGHIYFNLKDENSTISCVMFKGNNKSLKFRLEEGMSVIALASVSVYTPRGSYQLNIFSLEPEGVGALSLAYEQLKQKLQKLGWFDDSLKKPLPKFPKTIALVTSKTGAALQDMLKVAKKRYPLVKFILLDTQVQGEGSAIMIAQNIKQADSLNADIIIVGRGGGSMEDLWSFNEEIVAKAIYEASTPVISAVGHEIDFLISDFVADKRASTPSNAIEIALPDRTELLIMIDHLISNFDTIFQNTLSKKQETLQHLNYLYKENLLTQKITNKLSEVKLIEQNLKDLINLKLDKLLFDLQSLEKSLEQVNPSDDFPEYFAKISKNNHSLKLEELKNDDEFELSNPSIMIKAKVLEVKREEI